MVQTDQFIQRLHALYDSIAVWLRDSGLGSKLGTITLTEYDLEPYQAPVMQILGADSHPMASLRPVGVLVVGAHGRVDLVGGYGTRTIVYLSPGGPALATRVAEGGRTVEQHIRPLFPGVDAEGWYAVDQKRLTAQPLDPTLFRALLREVSDRAA